MKIYIAGPGSDWRSSAALGEALECEGHLITRKWWEEFAARERGEDVPAGPELVAADLEGVRAADAVVLNLPFSATTEGAWVEWGYAHGLGKLCVAYCHSASFEVWQQRIAERSIFIDLPDAHCVFSVSNLYGFLAEYAPLYLEQQRRAA